MMFGPPDGESPNSDQSTLWKIKRFTNDELRQKFVDATVPQALRLGLSLPDEALKWNETQERYDYGEIDWDEFWNVVKGHGPLNKARVAARKKALDEGAWVLDAAMTHAKKVSQLNITPIAAE